MNGRHSSWWLDPRTTSGSWRLARGFPNLPAWIVKAVGGTTTQWSGATPRFKAHEFAARSTYARGDGATLLDWPITLADLEPYYDKAEKKMGSTHRNNLAPLPANNNYKVLANGAERLGCSHYATGPYGTNPEPYAWKGKLSLCAVKDVFSGRIVGYLLDLRMGSLLTVNALKNVVARRGNVAGGVVHSDRGCQFRSRKLVCVLNPHRLVGTMGESVQLVITQPSNRLSGWYRTTFSTGNPGQHGKHSVLRL